MPATLVDIHNALRLAFAKGPVDKADLIALAIRRRAHPDVIDTPSSLPDGSYQNLLDIWQHLPDVSVR